MGTLVSLFPWTSTPGSLEYGVSSVLGITGEIMSFMMSNPLMVIMLCFSLAIAGIGVFSRLKRAAIR